MPALNFEILGLKKTSHVQTQGGLKVLLHPAYNLDLCTIRLPPFSRPGLFLALDGCLA